MKLQYAGATHVGMKRDHNEDNLMLLPEQNLFVVADGMGGHSSGEVASQIAVDTLRTFFQETEADDEITWPFKPDRDRTHDQNRLASSVKLANRNIFETALEDMRYKGMGTTFVGVHFPGGGSGVLTAHVGDSRVYRIRDGQIEQLTEDHSLLNDYKKIQQLTPEEEAAFPHKNIIVRALGMKEHVAVDVREDPPKPGDVFLLCSDGLNGEISDAEMLAGVTAHPDSLEDAVEALIQLACEHGGKDNVTCVLIKYVGD
jgi:protein phosphatase